jgi:hypothetical protein
MKRFLPFILFIFLTTFCTKNNPSDLEVTHPKTNNLENTSGTDKSPLFSWNGISEVRGTGQTAYQIILDDEKKNLKREDNCLWNSGKILSPESAWIRYNGPELQPATRYFWRVRVWDNNGKPSEWSSEASFITGLFEEADWSNAEWIGFEEIPDSLLLVPGVHGNGDNLGNIALRRTVNPCFRKEFSLEKRISHAYLFICGLGQYEVYINGIRECDRFLSPGWTNYYKTCLYNTYDVTKEIKEGRNAIGVIAGNGFYNINRERYRKLVIAYGAPKITLKLQVRYTDGSEETIVSDESWKTASSPITFSSIYGGEDYSAPLEQEGWDKAGFDDKNWSRVLITGAPGGTLKPEKDHPLKIMQIIEPERITGLTDTTFLFDFGQNASGIISLKIKGKKGQTVRLIPGELIDDNSLVTQKATGAPCYFSYTLKGADEETWSPRFTYYGFRYVQAEGVVSYDKPYHGDFPRITGMQLLHTRNSSPEVGSFKCSNELFNSIYELINWSIRSNLSSVATDCPHREKLGWLEQTHLMGNSIKYVYDIHNLYDKIIDDMIEAQLENGLVPDIAPEYVPFYAGFRDSPEWGSACVILPWDMYEWYGDIEAVRKAYPMMKKYLAYLGSTAENHIISHGLGDWYDLGPEFPGEAQLTPKAVTATSIYYYDTKLLSEMAGLLGELEDSILYSDSAEKIRKAFNEKFFNPVTKVYSTGSQTAYAMPLFFGIVDDTCRRKVVKNLAESVTESGKALTAGDIGYRYLLRVLEQEGYSQLIYEMNSRTDVPGYGFQLSKGATSLTESWAGLRDVSNNHMMLGHLMEWFYSGLGGIRQMPRSKAYEDILISPEIVGDITWAETSYLSVHGEIKTSWRVTDNILTLRVSVPAGCRATVLIPQSDPGKITENDIPVSSSEYIRSVGIQNHKTRCEVASGEYVFKTSL